MPSAITASHFLTKETAVTCAEVKAGSVAGNSWAEVAMNAA